MAHCGGLPSWKLCIELSLALAGASWWQQWQRNSTSTNSRRAQLCGVQQQWLVPSGCQRTALHAEVLQVGSTRFSHVVMFSGAEHNIP
jgi:hypothetical protein